MNTTQQRQCGSKVKYKASKAEAVAQMLHEKDGAVMVAYHCPWCGRWHVGHAAGSYRRQVETTKEGE